MQAVIVCAFAAKIFLLLWSLGATLLPKYLYFCGHWVQLCCQNIFTFTVIGCNFAAKIFVLLQSLGTTLRPKYLYFYGHWVQLCCQNICTFVVIECNFAAKIFVLLQSLGATVLPKYIYFCGPGEYIYCKNICISHCVYICSRKVCTCVVIVWTLTAKISVLLLSVSYFSLSKEEFVIVCLSECNFVPEYQFAAKTVLPKQSCQNSPAKTWSCQNSPAKKLF